MRAIVVDDHAGFRAAAGRLLAASGATVVGSAADLAEARDLIGTLTPDVVLLDVGLPDGSGFDLADELAAACERPLVVMTSSRPESTYRIRLANVSGVVFIGKDDLSISRLQTVLGV